jgi:hypothetical protein
VVSLGSKPRFYTTQNKQIFKQMKKIFFLKIMKVFFTYFWFKLLRFFQGQFSCLSHSQI